MIKRKVIEISACAWKMGEDVEERAYREVFALCDDGSIWVCANPDAPWRALPPIPQGDPERTTS